MKLLGRLTGQHSVVLASAAGDVWISLWRGIIVRSGRNSLQEGSFEILGSSNVALGPETQCVPELGKGPRHMATFWERGK